VGVGSERVLLVEDQVGPGSPRFTITSQTADGPSLSAWLEGTLVCGRTVTGDGLVRETDSRLLPDRDDERTAAYLIRHWMEQL
jgi:hypothetical protein